MEDLTTLKSQFLVYILPAVSKYGWNSVAARETSSRYYHDPHYYQLLYPTGIAEIVEDFITYHDHQMMINLETQDKTRLRTHERIAQAIKTRILQHNGQEEIVKATFRFYAYPPYVFQGTKRLMHTVDLMWRWAGDTSTDWNYYSKRMLLMGIYHSTLLYWLSDNSKDYQETWQFLNRRLHDVLILKKVKEKFLPFFSSP